MHSTIHMHLLPSYIRCSCIDGARKFFTVAFFIHLSLFVSLICAFVAFLAGVETAVQHRVSLKL